MERFTEVKWEEDHLRERGSSWERASFLGRLGRVGLAREVEGERERMVDLAVDIRDLKEAWGSGGGADGGGGVEGLEGEGRGKGELVTELV